MKTMGIDLDKMPLGKLSKAQVDKGHKILVEIEGAIAKKQTARCSELTSQYYTAVTSGGEERQTGAGRPAERPRARAWERADFRRWLSVVIPKTDA